MKAMVILNDSNKDNDPAKVSYNRQMLSMYGKTIDVYWDEARKIYKGGGWNWNPNWLITYRKFIYNKEVK